MLAVSGRRAGLAMWAVDRYLDQDTREAVLGGVCLGASRGHPRAAMQAAVEQLDPKEQAAVVYGGGLENDPDLLETLTLRRPLLGNSPEQLRALRTPRRFFALLQRLGIPSPKVRFDPPPNPKGWLLKAALSEGGLGVRTAESGRRPPLGYYQQHIKGPVCSVLFLADGHRHLEIGFNTLWSLEVGDRPFLYAGAANFTRLSLSIRERVRAWLPPLVTATGLVGLNSLDFVVTTDGIPLVLEINPRPPATLGLYDADVPQGLLRQHLQAVAGTLPGTAQIPAFRAQHVVLAPKALITTDETSWPPWCQDRPGPKTRIEAQQPFCTVVAQGLSPGETLRRLRHRLKIINHRLNPF